MENCIDYYDTADAEVIRAAYRTLAKKYHPDSRVEGKAEAEPKLRALNEAYEMLSNEVARQQYDRDKSAKAHVSSPDPIKEPGKQSDDTSSGR